jgi:putative DNA primase/helicase
LGSGDLIESTDEWKKLRFTDGRILSLRRSAKSRRFGGGGHRVLLSNYRLKDGELRRIHLNTVDPDVASVRMAMLVAADIAAELLWPDSKVALIYKGAEIIDLPRDESGEEAAPRDAGDDAAEIARLAKLSAIEYGRQREAAAARLKVGVTTLDRAVNAERSKNREAAGQGRVISFNEPDPWPGHVNGVMLLEQLTTVLRHYVVMPDHAVDAVALWIIHTYVIDWFEITPRLAITSPEKRCGKTTLRDVISRLVYRPLPTENATASAIFRIIDSNRPTLLIDEADTFFGERDDLRGILNSGHRRGGFVMRTVGDNFEPRQFSTHAAVAIAMIGKLAGTLADRSIPITMRRRRAADPKVESFRSDRVGHLDQLARRVTRWAIDNASRFEHADPRMPQGVFNRAADNWRPLLAIADAVGGEWQLRARKACTILTTDRDDDSLGVTLLRDIRDIRTAQRVDRITSEELVSALAKIEGHPWADWAHGKPITVNGVARLLKPYGITSGNIRVKNRIAKGYQFAHFDEAFERYLA